MSLLIRTCVLKGHESAPSHQIIKVTQLYRVGPIESSAYANQPVASLAVQPIQPAAGLGSKQPAD
ncbi:MAG: hypothetical protein ACI9OH_000239 [Oleispira sp.]|jgi:hypothetical protein